MGSVDQVWKGFTIQWHHVRTVWLYRGSLCWMVMEGLCRIGGNSLSCSFIGWHTKVCNPQHPRQSNTCSLTRSWSQAWWRMCWLRTAPAMPRVQTMSWSWSRSTTRGWCWQRTCRWMSTWQSSWARSFRLRLNWLSISGPSSPSLASVDPSATAWWHSMGFGPKVGPSNKTTSFWFYSIDSAMWLHQKMELNMFVQ